MVVNPRKCEFMGFGKTNENEVFTYHKIRLKKTTTKKPLGITIDEHLNFNDHVTSVYKSASRKLNALLRVLLFLAINRKRCQTLSSMDNSDIVLSFGYLVLLRFTEKSTNYTRGLYLFIIMSTPRAMANF